MTGNGSAEAPIALEPLDRVGHLLIRSTNGDEMDPFFVRGHPGWPNQPDAMLLACFYYAIVVTPKITMMFDNDGRGGMCDLVPHEVTGIWRTKTILDELGITYEALKDGTAVFEATSLPAPEFRPDWTEDPEETVSPAPGC